MPVYEYKIGTILVGMTNIESLTTPVPNPKPFYRPYVEIVETLSGNDFGRGPAEVDWVWNIFTREQRDQLRTFCTGSSSLVYIRTRTNDNSDEYKNYQAVMHWPLDEERDAGKRLDFKITFTHLVEQMEEEPA